MLLLRTEKLRGGAEWLYEIKFDSYRALAIKTGGKVSFVRATTMISPCVIRT
jgi:ATP-dependent DNA ligase